MPIRKQNSTKIEKAYETNTVLERFKFSAIGSSGLDSFNGIPETELVSDLRYPRCNKTYRQMLLHPAINASNALHKSMVGEAKFRFLPPKEATVLEKEQTLIVEQMFGDMEHTLSDSVKHAMTMIDYGYAPLEIIWRYRTKASGSLYNDGLVSIRKLALRHQESICKPVWDTQDSEKLVGLVQDTSLLSNNCYGSYSSVKKKTIPVKNKLLIFKTGDAAGSPFGTCPLRNAYLPWKYLQAIEELEASGVAKDLQGLPVLYVPHQFMQEDATVGQKEFYKYAQNAVRNMQMNNQAGVVLPTIIDQETRTQSVKLELLDTSGKKNYDTDKIKSYYRMMIFVSLASDILLQGNTSVGSFALGSLKNSMTGTAVENYLKHIISVLNNDLIRSIYEMNNWEVSRRCVIDYEGFESNDLATYGQALQRISSVGLLPKTLNVVNTVLRTLGIDELPEETTQEELDAILSDVTSKSGNGLATAFDGTGTSIEAGVGNNNANNLANAA